MGTVSSLPYHALDNSSDSDNEGTIFAKKPKKSGGYGALTHSHPALTSLSHTLLNQKSPELNQTSPSKTLTAKAVTIKQVFVQSVDIKAEIERLSNLKEIERLIQINQIPQAKVLIAQAWELLKKITDPELHQEMEILIAGSEYLITRLEPVGEILPIVD